MLFKKISEISIVLHSIKNRMNSPLRIFVFFLPKIKSRSDQTLVHIGHRMSYCADDQFIIIFARSDMDVAAVLSVARCYTILM